MIFGYPLGKSQRVLSGLDPAIGPIFCHGAVERINRIYRASGVALPETLYSGDMPKGHDFSQCNRDCAAVCARLDLDEEVRDVVRPPWFRAGCAFAGHGGRRSIDRGFVFSDHADWPGLQQAILRYRSGMRSGHAWLSRADGALAAGTGQRGAGARNQIRRRGRRDRRPDEAEAAE